MDDFDVLLDLDAAAVAAGAEAGRAAAAASSTRDGFALGYTKGGELAVEVRLELENAGRRSCCTLQGSCCSILTSSYGVDIGVCESGRQLRGLSGSMGEHLAGSA